jgi:hypothetical protein
VYIFPSYIMLKLSQIGENCYVGAAILGWVGVCALSQSSVVCKLSLAAAVYSIWKQNNAI